MQKEPPTAIPVAELQGAVFWAEAVEWASTVLESPVTVESVSKMPWSTVVSVCTPSGKYWLKSAQPSAMSTEVSVLKLLLETNENGYPVLLANNLPRGFALTEHVAGRVLKSSEMGRARKVVRDLAANISDEKLARRVPTLSLSTAAAQLAEMLQREPFKLNDGRTAEIAARELKKAANFLAAADLLLPNRQLIHGDLHPGNAIVTDANLVVVLDWADAYYASQVWDDATVSDELGPLDGLTFKFLGSLKSLFDLMKSEWSDELNCAPTVQREIRDHRKGLAIQMVRSMPAETPIPFPGKARTGVRAELEQL